MNINDLKFYRNVQPKFFKEFFNLCKNNFFLPVIDETGEICDVQVTTETTDNTVRIFNGFVYTGYLSEDIKDILLSFKDAPIVQWIGMFLKLKEAKINPLFVGYVSYDNIACIIGDDMKVYNCSLDCILDFSHLESNDNFLELVKAKLYNLDKTIQIYKED